VDSLAGGRLQLGLGAGWQEREHDAFGFDLLDTKRRFARLEEGLEVATRLLRNEEPVSFEGEFYRLRDALLTVRSPRPAGPPVVIGGNGPRRTLPLAVRFADEWNGVFLTADQFADLNARLEGLLREAGRTPEDVRRTLMTRGVFGRTRAEVDRKLDGVAREDLDAAVIAGTADEFVDRLGRLSDVGVQRVMLQWLEPDDLAGLEAMAGSVLPQL
jgi:alkanesulfonate monooxygenase SsuD/methylene tetrahydromethanopterin reductase-like flavin-dependent oxidoreductase (luciferase family)